MPVSSEKERCPFIEHDEVDGTGGIHFSRMFNSSYEWISIPHNDI